MIKLTAKEAKTAASDSSGSLAGQNSRPTAGAT